MAEEILLQKQENTRSINKDRLSELSDELLVHILSFLPTKDAVKTLLLRRFGNLWTLLPTLDFHYGYNYKSSNFISNVMKYHKRPTIDRWEFKGHRMLHQDIEEKLRNWVDLALKKKPKVMGIHTRFGIDDNNIKFHNIYFSKSIITLKLSQVPLNLPRLVNMGSLTTLKLVLVDMVDEDLKVLEIGCPCLRELCFMYPRGLTKFHFTAPNIESLKLSFGRGGDHKSYSVDCPKLKLLDIRKVCLNNLELVDVSSVTHARIYKPSNIEIHYFELLYNKFQNAKVFHLEDHIGFAVFLGVQVSMQLEKCGNEKLGFLQNKFSLIALKSIFQKSCLMGICRLLRNSRYLEQLILFVDVDIFCNCNMLQQEISSPCEMQYLKSVTVHDFEKYCKTLLQLIEFLLKNAVILEKLVIVCNNKDHHFSTKGVEFMLELLSLPRASRNARIVIA